MSEQFKRKLTKIGIVLNKKQEEQLKLYYEIMIEKNKVMNLTNITEYEEVNDKHFLDSLSIAKCIDLNNYGSLVDIGTGAGFPGIPIKIVFPHVKVVLVDSLNKRVTFLKEVIETLGLENIEAVHSRAEDFSRENKWRESFDLVVSRAVSNLSTLSEYCVPCIKIGGLFVSYKSGNVDEELLQAKGAVQKLGCKVKSVEKFTLPETEISRSFVMIEKVKKTDKKYPRKSGLPKKEPLT